MADEPVHRWRIETNDRYSKIVNSVISLATGALVLPAMFLRQFLGLQKEKALTPFLTPAAYTSWICLGLSIFFGLAYSWFSVKWIKLAWGQKISVSACSLEWILDVFFLLMLVFFLVGIGANVWFFVTVCRGN